LAAGPNRLGVIASDQEPKDEAEGYADCGRDQIIA
jgi:hypothetical protein